MNGLEADEIKQMLVWLDKASVEQLIVLGRLMENSVNERVFRAGVDSGLLVEEKK